MIPVELNPVSARHLLANRDEARIGKPTLDAMWFSQVNREHMAERTVTDQKRAPVGMDGTAV